MKKQFKIIEVNGHQHVVRYKLRKLYQNYSVEDQLSGIDQPNYLGTGMAFCGILKPGQSLDDFVMNYKAQKANAKPVAAS